MATHFKIGRAIRISRWFLLGLAGFMALGPASFGLVRAEPPMQLTDGQLDRTISGAFAMITGDGQALGAQSASKAAVAFVLGNGNEANTIASGSVRSAASSPSSSAPATASSSLQLRVVFP